MKILHLTDIHLNFLTTPDGRSLSEPLVEKFCMSLMLKEPDAIIISGDISESQHLKLHLAWMRKYIHSSVNIYFVLGNHDYYNGAIPDIRRGLVNYDGSVGDNMFWLPVSGIQEMSPKVCVIGHDGWYDGGYSDWFQSRLVMTDYMVIEDFRFKSQKHVHARMQVLAQDFVDHISKVGEEALQKYDHVIVATHVPPFKQNTIFKGAVSDSNWLPVMSSKLAGDCLLALATAHPDKKITVLCGHTHGRAEYRPLVNLEVYTGSATYGYPTVSNILEIEE